VTHPGIPMPDQSSSIDIEQELQISEARFRVVFETSAIGICIIGSDQKMIDANPALCRMIGNTCEEMKTMRFGDLVHPEDAALERDYYSQISGGEISFYNVEARIVRKDNTLFWGRITNSVVRTRDEKPVFSVVMVEDIDEQRRIISELQQSEARFRAMFENAAVGIGIMSLDRTILDANPAMCRMLGLSREEMIGNTPIIATYAEDYPQSTQEYYELIAGRRNYYWSERRYVRKNGEVFWAHVTMSVVRNAEGEPIYLVGMVIDIDDRKRALQELSESEERFRTIYDNAEIGIVIANLSQVDQQWGSAPDGVMEESLFFHLVEEQRFNPALMRLFGYTEDELKSIEIANLIFPADRRSDVALRGELFAGKRDSYRIEKRYVRKDGDVFWGRLNYSLVRDSNGHPRVAIGIIEDITEERKARENLRESEARFRAMFDNTSVGMALMTLDRRIVAANQAAERIVGYSEEDLTKIDPADLSHPEDRQIGMVEFREMASGQRPGFQMEKRYVRKDGRVIWARVTYSIVPDINGKPQYLVGLIEDINEQKLSGEKLAQQEADYRRMLEERVEARTHELAEANSRLLKEIEQRQRVEEALAAKAAEDAVISERNRLARDLHDAVTQTLFSASLIAEVLPDLWLIDAEEARKSTDELRQLTRGALAEMRTLLLELRPATLTQTRFADLLRQLSEALIGRARLPIHLSVEGERTLPPEVQVVLYRIAQESLNNIIKYARATQVEVNLVLSAAGVLLEISDNGIGFDTSTLKPTSLGMRIMRERAEAIGAEFFVSSKPGEGTTVSVTWVER
jgi:PAS domain S-box-containing protein